MEQEVYAFIKKHKLIQKHTTVLVGVSGGPDSVALLHLLKNLKRKWELTIVAVTVDHGLRGEASALDRKYVEELCEEWDIPCIAREVDVRAYQQKKGVSEEVAARTMRYLVYQDVMKEWNADVIALGHHADDQIETMLMRLARIATSNAFKGIPVRRAFAEGEIIRPFLSITKAAILNYLSRHELMYRIDETNENDAYTRNYYRKHMVPLLKDKNPKLPETIQTLSETLAEDEWYLKEQAKIKVEKIVDFDEKSKEICFEADAFRELPNALQRRGFHLILNYLYGTLPKDLSYIHEANFFDLLMRRNGNTSLDFPSKLRMTNAYGQIRMYFGYQSPPESAYSSTLTVPGEIALSDGTKIAATLVSGTQEEDSYTFVCPLQSISLPLHIRSRRAGDRMSIRGLNGSKKLKDIFIDAKIPQNLRDNWPVIVDDKGVILWVVGLKKAQTAIDGLGMNIKLICHRDNN